MTTYSNHGKLPNKDCEFTFADDADHEPKIEADDEPQTSDLFMKTDLHGLPELYESFKRRRCGAIILWTFIVIVAVAILVWQVIETYNDFRDNPIITTYGLVVDAEGVPFPTVYICPRNPIHQSNLREANVDPEWMKMNFASILNSGELNGLTGILADKISLKDKVMGVEDVPEGFIDGADDLPPGSTIPWTPTSEVDFLMRVGYNVEQLFEECAFQARSFDCNSRIRPVFDSSRGKCFAIKFDEALQSVEKSGLSLVLNLDLDEAAVKKSGDEYYQPPAMFDGVTIELSMGHKSAVESSIISTAASTATHTQMTIESTQLQLLNLKDRQNCYEDGEGETLLQIYNTTYSTSICKLDCVTQRIYSKCNCIMPMDRSLLSDAFQKLNETELFCNAVQKTSGGCFESEINSVVGRKANKQCFTICHNPCNLWQMRLDTTATNFPSAVFLKVQESVAQSEAVQSHNNKSDSLEQTSSGSISSYDIGLEIPGDYVDPPDNYDITQINYPLPEYSIDEHLNNDDQIRETDGIYDTQNYYDGEYPIGPDLDAWAEMQAEADAELAAAQSALQSKATNKRQSPPSDVTEMDFDHQFVPPWRSCKFDTIIMRMGSERNFTSRLDDRFVVECYQQWNSGNAASRIKGCIHPKTNKFVRLDQILPPDEQFQCKLANLDGIVIGRIVSTDKPSCRNRSRGNINCTIFPKHVLSYRYNTDVGHCESINPACLNDDGIIFPSMKLCTEVCEDVCSQRMYASSENTRCNEMTSLQAPTTIVFMKAPGNEQKCTAVEHVFCTLGPSVFATEEDCLERTKHCAERHTKLVTKADCIHRGTYMEIDDELDFELSVDGEIIVYKVKCRRGFKGSASFEQMLGCVSNNKTIAIDATTSDGLHKCSQFSTNGSVDDNFSYAKFVLLDNHQSNSRSKRQVDEKTLQYSDTIVLDIAYNHLQYVTMKQEASMTFSTFVGNIGGQIGLWIGASIISCVKLFIIVAPLIYVKIKQLFT